MLASGAILGLIAGLALGRTWRPLVAVRIRWLPLLLAGLLVRGIAPLIPGIGLVLYVFALASTAVVAGANYRIFGALLIAIGGALNLVVVVVNGGMPVDPGAVAAAGASMPTDALHVLLVDSTRLKELADVIAFPLAHSVYSIGDFSIAIGAFLVPFVLLLRR